MAEEFIQKEPDYPCGRTSYKECRYWNENDPMNSIICVHDNTPSELRVGIVRKCNDLDLESNPESHNIL